MDFTQALPIGFTINGYQILTVLQTDELNCVYQVSKDDGSTYLMREFCPQGYAVRDPESGKLRYPDEISIEEVIIPLKQSFEAQYSMGATDEMSTLGTIYFLYQQTEAVPQKATPQPRTVTNPALTGLPKPIVKQKKSSAWIWIILLLVLGGGSFAFLQFGNKNEELKAEESTKVSQEAEAQPKKNKKPKKKKEQESEKSAQKEHEAQGTTLSSQEDESAPPTPAATAEETINGDEEETESDTTDNPDTATPSAQSFTDEAEESDDSDESDESEAKQDKQDSRAKSNAQTKQKKKKTKQTTSMAAVQSFIKNYAKPMTLQQWKEEYAEMYTSWFGDSDDVAKGWITTFGPLGFRARGLDASWPEKGFRNAFPKQFVDPNGEPAVNLYQVTQVIKGSPAEGHIKVGDIILGIDGEVFKTACSLQLPYGPYQNQDRRGLDLHAGLLVDKAEGVGKITLNIIPADEVEKIPPLEPIWKEVFRQEKASGELVLDLPIKGGQQIRLQVDDSGNGIACDGFEWENLTLVGEGKTIPFAKLPKISYSVGYGEAKYEEDRKVWQAHANSSIVFDIPKGNWTLKGKGIPRPAASVGISIHLGSAASVPPSVKKFVKNVTFPIPKLGSFAEGFPKNCAKTKAVVQMLAEWLVAQQREDGSWDRPGGYCGNHYDTAWAGLGLMATGNPKYDPAIKKAAHYIAFSGSQCWWAVPQATAGIFLCEYWLRYRDNSVLPAIRNGVQRMKNEDLYGDYVTGHGIHPGYSGTGVSIGGSHMCLFLALASKTPAKVDDGVLDKMMDHAQEICPTGMGPYGRTTERFTFEPDRTCGGTYSGRHGPYFIASLICGGPELYTKNSKIMYKEGPIGGCDQGHSSETLSIMWALQGYWRTDPEIFYKNMEAFRWKLTLLRTFDSGLIQNPNRLELMTADPVIGVYIRTGSWITALCTEKRNLAITGKPEFQAKEFRKVPAINDTESRFLSTYIRNWSLVNAALGAKAPAGIKEVIKELKSIPVKSGCRFKLIEIMNAKAVPLVKELMAIQGVDQLTKATCAEMLLGMDVQIFFDPKVDDNKLGSGEYGLAVNIRQPLGGRTIGLHQDQHKETRDKANALYKYDFSGSVTFKTKDSFNPLEEIKWDTKSNFRGDWNVYEYKKDVTGPTEPKVYNMSADIKWKVDDLTVEYTRPIAVGGFEVGCSEKAHPVTNCNHLWVPGILIRDHGNWGCSFTLPDGTFISAASQGNQILVHDETDKKNKKEKKDWVSPNDACLPMGSQGMFRISQDWLGLECRVSEFKLRKIQSEEVEYKLKTADGQSVELNNLLDKDATTSEELTVPGGGKEGKLTLEVFLKETVPVRAVDIKLNRSDARFVIEAFKNGKWVPVHWGSGRSSVDNMSDAQKAMYADQPDVLRMTQLPGNGFIKCMRTFDPVTTNKLRIHIDKTGDKVKVAELRVHRAVQTKQAETRSSSGVKSKE